MSRHLALLLAAFCLLAAWPIHASAQPTTYLGPTRILLVDADTVITVVTRDWQSAATRHQEKLLRYGARMKYWAEHLPPDMRTVFEELGYPTGRVLLTPIGHTEEWWYYGALGPPLRFRDGALLDTDRFEDLLPR